MQANHINAVYEAWRDDKDGLWDTRQLEKWTDIKLVQKTKCMAYITETKTWQATLKRRVAILEKFIAMRSMDARIPTDFPLPILAHFDVTIPIMPTLNKPDIKRFEDEFKQIYGDAKLKMHALIYEKVAFELEFLAEAQKTSFAKLENCEPSTLEHIRTFTDVFLRRENKVQFLKDYRESMDEEDELLDVSTILDLF
ncbi:unnamed protein product [Didymodactylos carnosus]|uniref:Uncharacterized protein n=1 Tax=Didymodactylos carnosus TaxID=1234261 RepID=A0A815ZIN7_9BILA|nr:unnamed protein product [Didymodactylos carnosus]CAF1585161.1 unnamed protein product [Didymodactylos carnosus]CAF3597348.1 unnamed protein product [Didymodactylos carnosus]CAF4454441.1 unnamed protein product [Didymodactylos carnosus]